MIQVRSESALSFGYKPGGWSHLNEVSGCLAWSEVHALALLTRKQAALGRPDLSCTFLAHHELESV